MITHVEDKNKFKNQESIFKQQSEQMLRNAQLQVREHTMLGRNETEYYGGMLSRELEAQNDFAMEHARNSQKDIEAESKKSRDKRRKQYEENRIQHGSNVTMETAAMQRNIVRYQKDWKKEQKKLEKNSEKDIKKAAGAVNVSTDLFDITMIKGSKQHIDIKRIMHACDLLVWFQQNSSKIDRLPIDQRVKINAGIAALPQLLNARNALLASHALNENGAISQRAQGDEGESSNIGIAEMIQEQRMLTHTAAVEQAVNAYKQALQEGFAQQRQNLRIDLQLGTKQKDELDKQVEKKRAQYSREWNQWKLDNIHYALNDQSGGDSGELFQDTLNWKKELDERKILIEAKRELLRQQEQKGDTDSAEKLRALILMDEQSADYQEALHQSSRMMRMFKGVFEGKPLTTAMRLELAERYHFGEFAINEVAQTTDAEIQAAVESAKNKSRNITLSDKEKKDKGRREKRADRLQSFLGAKAIADLSEKELKEYGVDKETVDNLEERRINLMQLEKWLKSDAKMKELENSLKLEEESEAKKESGWDKVGNITDVGSDILDKLDKIVSTTDYEEQQRLTKELYEDSEFVNYLGMAGDVVSGLSDVLSVVNIVKNIKDWKEQSAEDRIQTISDILSVGGDTARLYYSYISNLENAGDIAGHVGSGVDILGGVTGMVTSAVKWGKSNARRVHTRNKMKDLGQKKKQGALLNDIGHLQKILGAANKTAGIDMTDDIINFVTNTIKTANTIAKIASFGLAEVAEVPVKLATWMIESISGKVVQHRKAKLRRQYVIEHYEDFIKTIEHKNSKGEEFANLSDRDIKHTFLKFLGVKSGKRSEAGIRKIAKDSEYLKDNDHAGGTDEEKELDGYKKETLESMSLEKDAERSEIMQAMGATEKQAANPIIESNRIYRDQIRRGKDFKEGWFGRAWRKTKRWLKG